MPPGMFTTLVASVFWMKFRLDLVELETTSGYLSHKVDKDKYPLLLKNRIYLIGVIFILLFLIRGVARHCDYWETDG